MFGALRQNNRVYVLDKGEKPTLKIGQVTAVTSPAPVYGQYNSYTVDVTVSLDGQTSVFQQLPSTSSIATSNGLVVAETADVMAVEVEGLMRNSQQILDNIEHHKTVVNECSEILKTLNPKYAKDKQQEEKIDILENKVTGIEESLGSIKDMLSKVLDK